MSQSRVVKGADLAASRRRRSRRTRRLAAGALARGAFLAGAVMGVRSREPPYRRLAARYPAAGERGDYARMWALSDGPRRPGAATFAARQRTAAETATVRAWHF